MKKAFSGTSAGTAHADIYIQSTCKYIGEILRFVYVFAG
jgi:hypothetical protein